MVKRLSEFKKNNLIFLIGSGLKASTIALQLRISTRAVQRYIRKFSSGQIEATRAHIGRKKVLNEKDANRLYKNALKNPKSSAKDILMLTKHVVRKKPSLTTVKNCLKNKGLKSCTAATKPYLNERHKQERLKMALDLVKKEDEYFENIIFSDESVFSLSGNYGRIKVWRHKNTRYEQKHLVMSEKFGGGKEYHGMGLYDDVWVE